MLLLCAVFRSAFLNAGSTRDEACAKPIGERLTLHTGIKGMQRFSISLSQTSLRYRGSDLDRTLMYKAPVQLRKDYSFFCSGYNATPEAYYVLVFVIVRRKEEFRRQCR